MHVTMFQELIFATQLLFFVCKCDSLISLSAPSYTSHSSAITVIQSREGQQVGKKQLDEIYILFISTAVG